MFIRFSSLEKYPRINHFVSTRHGGVSKGAFASLNIGFGTDDDPDSVLKNRYRLADATGIALDKWVALNQVHETRVAIVTPEMRGLGAHNRESAIRATDAAITNHRDICLFVMGADCVPILFYDPVAGVIGACHAGWRGTVKKIAVETVKQMVATYGCKPENINAAIGPSIGACCYNVGGEVIDAVLRAFGTTDGFITFSEPDSQPRFDLWHANRHQMEGIGLLPEHIETAGICTQCHSQDFFSSRAGKGITGRFGAGIILL
jgi:YfiH family protein